jgi:TonB family protein
MTTRAGIAMTLGMVLAMAGSAQADKKKTKTKEKAPAPAAATHTVKLKAKAGLGRLGEHTLDAARFDLRKRRKRISAAPVFEEVMRFEKQRLDPKTVTRVIKAKRSGLRDCYTRAVARSRKDIGEVTVRFVVEPKGHVTHIAVNASGKNGRRLRRCMTRQIKRWRFPRADAETHVDYPFVFDVAGSTLADE